MIWTQLEAFVFEYFPEKTLETDENWTQIALSTLVAGHLPQNYHTVRKQ